MGPFSSGKRPLISYFSTFFHNLWHQAIICPHYCVALKGFCVTFEPGGFALKTNVACRRWCSLSLPPYRLRSGNRWGWTVWKCIIKYFITGRSRSKYMTWKQSHAFEGKSSLWIRCLGVEKKKRIRWYILSYFCPDGKRLKTVQSLKLDSSSSSSSTCTVHLLQKMGMKTLSTSSWFNLANKSALFYIWPCYHIYTAHCQNLFSHTHALAGVLPR